MKKLLIFLALFTLLFSCNKNEEPTPENKNISKIENEEIKVITFKDGVKSNGNIQILNYIEDGGQIIVAVEMPSTGGVQLKKIDIEYPNKFSVELPDIEDEHLIDVELQFRGYDISNKEAKVNFAQFWYWYNGKYKGDILKVDLSKGFNFYTIREKEYITPKNQLMYFYSNADVEIKGSITANEWTSVEYDLTLEKGWNICYAESEPYFSKLITTKPSNIYTWCMILE